MTYLADMASMGGSISASMGGMSLSGISLGRMAASLVALQGADDATAHTLATPIWIAAVSLAFLAIVVLVVLIVLAVVALKAKALLEKTTAEVKAKAYPIVDKVNTLVGDLSPTIKDITEKGNKLMGDMSPKIVGITEKANKLVGDMTPKIVEITEKANKLVGDMSPKILEITDKANTLVGDMTPKINGITDDVRGITTHAKDIAGMVKGKVEDLSPQVDEVVNSTKETILKANQTVQDANTKTHEQIDRMNEAVTDVFNKTAAIGESIGRGIQVPGREIGTFITTLRTKIDGVVHGVKGFASSMQDKKGRSKRTDAASTPNWPGYDSDAASIKATAAAASAFEQAEKEDIAL